jgi:hypothetical protein
MSKEIKPPKIPKKTKSVFHKKSDAGKGDVPRVGITLDEWGERWEKIFKKSKNKEKSDEK